MNDTNCYFDPVSEVNILFCSESHDFFPANLCFVAILFFILAFLRVRARPSVRRPGEARGTGSS